MTIAAAVFTAVGLLLAVAAGAHIVRWNRARWTWATQLGEAYSDTREHQPLALAYLALGSGVTVFGLALLLLASAAAALH